MKDAKHTPGPWRITNGGSHVIADASEWKSIAGVYGDNADCSWDERMSANAHLIAAAPELLAVLKDVLVRHDDEVTVGGQVYTDREKIVAAIEKAEGGAS